MGLVQAYREAIENSAAIVQAVLKGPKGAQKIYNKCRKDNPGKGQEYCARVAWQAFCQSKDGKDYIISYNDCCGKHFCGRCFCNRNEGERPAYHWYRNNDINWCAGTKTQVYHCSTALVVGLANEAQPEK